MPKFKVETIDGSNYAGRARRGETRIVDESQVQGERDHRAAERRTAPSRSSDSTRVTQIR